MISSISLSHGPPLILPSWTNYDKSNKLRQQAPNLPISKPNNNHITLLRRTTLWWTLSLGNDFCARFSLTNVSWLFSSVEVFLFLSIAAHVNTSSYDKLVDNWLLLALCVYITGPHTTAVPARSADHWIRYLDIEDNSGLSPTRDILIWKGDIWKLYDWKLNGPKYCSLMIKTDISE